MTETKKIRLEEKVGENIEAKEDVKKEEERKEE